MTWSCSSCYPVGDAAEVCDQSATKPDDRSTVAAGCPHGPGLAVVDDCAGLHPVYRVWRVHHPGKIKKRRLTWFTFPIATLAITLLTIGTAKGYLGSSIEHNRVILRDVTEDGLICREQQFDLYFQGSTARSRSRYGTRRLRRLPTSRSATSPAIALHSRSRPGRSCFSGNPTGQATLIQALAAMKTPAQPLCPVSTRAEAPRGDREDEV